VKALRFERSVPRFAAARLAGMRKPGRGAAFGPLELDRSAAAPALPGPDWVRVRPRLAGICGSDLATVDGRSSRYFEPIVSFPFVPGHEVVGDLDDGRRVVIEPVLGCVARSIRPVCAACAKGDLGRCERITFGALKPGLQSGFCCETGGGWSTSMVAAPSQLHSVPDELTDEDAVMVEPAACAVHAALSAGPLDGAVVAVIGAGTLGLLTIAAMTRFNAPAQLLVAAKHPEQRALATRFGATNVVSTGALVRAVRLATGSMAIGDGDIERLTGGADVVFDCVGSSASITEALSVVRPGGRVVLVGMPATVKLDLTPLWHREISLVGAYAYGVEPLVNGTRTFDLAFELVASHGLGSLVSATYPIDQYEDAIAHAAAAGARGAVKIAFDLRNEKERNR
jgi:threonine dehydrogenase-like Zn-dependent dehydrogenase